MAVYVALDVFLIIFCLLGASLHKRTHHPNVKFFYVLIFLLLFFVAAFRGDFTTDYRGYEDIYDYNRNRTLADILLNWTNNYPETGYLVFQFLVTKIFNNKLFVFILSSAFVVFAYLKEIEEQFPTKIVPLLLFVELGTYYSSFNLVRQIMAAAIIVLGLKYLYNKDLLKYIIIVLVAATFHTTALVMIPMYFVLHVKWGKTMLWICGISVIVISVCLPTLLRLGTQYIWKAYNAENLLQSGFSFKNLVGPLFIAAFPIANHLIKKNPNDIKENIWLNGTYIYLALSIMGMQVSLVTRFSSFFSIFAVLSFSNSLYRIKNVRDRTLMTFAILIVVILYGFVVRKGSGYDPYYFIWNRIML